MLQWTTSSSLCSAPPRHWTPQRATQRHQWRKCCRPALQLQYQKPNNDSGSQTAHHAHCAQTPTTPTTITHLLARSAASATTDPSSTHSWSCPGTPRRPSLAQRSRQWRIPGSCTPTRRRTRHSQCNTPARARCIRACTPTHPTAAAPSCPRPIVIGVQNENSCDVAANTVQLGEKFAPPTTNTLLPCTAARTTTQHRHSHVGTGC